MSAGKTFYITTAIDYPNSDPHIGHAYEKVVADFYARFHRLLGSDTRFVIGLDEHGQKIQEAAARAGLTPQAFVDERAKAFHALYGKLEISHDDFIRTSEQRHHEFAVWLYERIRSAGDVYKGIYKADYCISCEKALTKSELVDGKCPIHDRPTTTIEEPTYFFRLGKYRDAIRDHISRNPSFVVPQERRNEVLARLGEEVLDLSISRSTFEWGIPLPDDPEHVLYVWVDALSNYISALKSPVDVYDRYWPADSHVIGKDILWFHAVIWPALLLSAGLPLPRQVYVHGFILDQDGRKMAKTLGNVVDPMEVAREHGADVLRYYFLRAFASGQDGKFSLQELEDRRESELGNDLGNLVMRVAKLAVTRVGTAVPPPPRVRPGDLDATRLASEFRALVDAREHSRALDSLWAYVRAINVFINDRAPWKSKDAEEVHGVVYACLDALRVTLHLLSAAMPGITARAAASLGFELGPLAALSAWSHTYTVTQDTPLFPRREPAPGKGGPPAAPPHAPKAASGAKDGPAAAGDPFAALELRVGLVVEARPHPDADSLFALTVDVGGEQRSICAGLRGHLEASDLPGRKVLIVANLKPAKFRGIESRGMVLAAAERGGRIVPVDPGAAESGDLARVDGIESRPRSKISIGDFEKAPLSVRDGRVTYGGKPLRTARGDVRADSDDGTPVT